MDLILKFGFIKMKWESLRQLVWVLPWYGHALYAHLKNIAQERRKKESDSQQDDRHQIAERLEFD